MTIIIYLLNNCDAGTCNSNISVCTTSFTNIQNVPSKINIDQEVHSLICLFEDFQCSIQQCQDSKGDTACLGFIFVTLLNKLKNLYQWIYTHKTKSLATLKPSFYCRCREMCQHSLSIYSDLWYSSRKGGD